MGTYQWINRKSQWNLQFVVSLHLPIWGASVNAKKNYTLIRKSHSCWYSDATIEGYLCCCWYWFSHLAPNIPDVWVYGCTALLSHFALAFCLLVWLSVFILLAGTDLSNVLVMVDVRVLCLNAQRENCRPSISRHPDAIYKTGQLIQFISPSGFVGPTAHEPYDNVASHVVLYSTIIANAGNKR